MTNCTISISGNVFPLLEKCGSSSMNLSFFSDIASSRLIAEICSEWRVWIPWRSLGPLKSRTESNWEVLKLNLMWIFGHDGRDSNHNQPPRFTSADDDVLGSRKVLDKILHRDPDVPLGQIHLKINELPMVFIEKL